MTLLLSYLIFTKPLTEQHGSGLLLIAMGITLKMLPDSKFSNTKRVLTSSSARANSAKSNDDEELENLSDSVRESDERRPLV